MALLTFTEGAWFVWFTMATAGMAIQDCSDAKGNPVPDGTEFHPSHDPCQVCVCDKGQLAQCHSVQCQEPECELYRKIDGTCCTYTCITPPNHPGIADTNNNITLQPEIVNHAYSNWDDLGLRLVASTITSLLILALVLFMIHRLRQRRMLVLMRRLSDECADQEEITAYMTQLDSTEVVPSSMDLPPYEEPPPPYTPPKPPDVLPADAPPPYREQMSDGESATNCSSAHRTGTISRLLGAAEGVTPTSIRNSVTSVNSDYNGNSYIHGFEQAHVNMPIDSYGNLFAEATLSIGLREADNASCNHDTCSHLPLGRNQRPIYVNTGPHHEKCGSLSRPGSLGPGWTGNPESHNYDHKARNSYCVGGEEPELHTSDATMPDILCVHGIGNSNKATNTLSRQSVNLDSCFPHIGERRQSSDSRMTSSFISMFSPTCTSVQTSMTESTMCDSIEMDQLNGPSYSQSPDGEAVVDSDCQHVDAATGTHRTSPTCTRSPVSPILEHGESPSVLSSPETSPSGAHPPRSSSHSHQAAKAPLPRSGSMLSQYSVCSETGEQRRPRLSPGAIGNDVQYPEMDPSKPAVIPTHLEKLNNVSNDSHVDTGLNSSCHSASKQKSTPALPNTGTKEKEFKNNKNETAQKFVKGRKNESHDSTGQEPEKVKCVHRRSRDLSPNRKKKISLGLDGSTNVRQYGFVDGPGALISKSLAVGSHPKERRQDTDKISNKSSLDSSNNRLVSKDGRLASPHETQTHTRSSSLDETHADASVSVNKSEKRPKNIPKSKAKRKSMGDQPESCCDNCQRDFTKPVKMSDCYHLEKTDL